MGRYDNVEKRMSQNNYAEDQFKNLLEFNKIPYHHIGFQKSYKEEEWDLLNKYLKKIPDFIAFIDSIPKFYEVKAATDTFLLKTYAHKIVGRWQVQHPVVYTILQKGHEFLYIDWDVMDKISKNYQEKKVLDVMGKEISMDELRSL